MPLKEQPWMAGNISLELNLPEEVLQTARACKLLDTPPEDCFDRMTRLAGRLLGVEVALVTVMDKDRQFFKSAQGLPEPWQSRRETPLSHSFCQHVVARSQPLIVQDARLHETLQHNLAIPDLGVVAYLGVPLALKGVAFGALCVVDQEARDWSTKDLETLQDLAQNVVTEIEFRILSARLEAAHETLSEQNGQLEQVIERQNEFLGMAAHDMRTPLTVAIGYSSVLAAKSSTLTPAHLKMAQAIGRSCQFMVRLIDDLLDLEALKSGKLSLSLQPTPTRDFLLQLLDTNRLLAAAKQIEIEVQADEFLPDLHIDRHKFEQVLNNLLGNAIKYSPTSTFIQVSAHEQQGRLEIRVQDQGPGIAPDKIDKIFQPFQRGESHQQKGVGLGLAIVDRIVREHGGTIRVTSQLEKGSCFVVSMPLKGSNTSLTEL